MDKPIKTAYEVHERLYQRYRLDPARTGWNKGEDLVGTIERVRELLDWPGVVRAGRLLEIGSGAGQLSIEAASRGFDVTGIELSATAGAWASENAAVAGVRASFARGDVRWLPFCDAAFDVVLDGALLHCIIGPDRAMVLNEVNRVLCPGGQMLVFTMCNPRPGPPGLDLETGIVWTGDMATRYVGSADSILDELRAARFEVVRATVTPEDLDPDDLRALVVRR